MDDKPSFAERRARAAELRQDDLTALRAGEVRGTYVLALWFVLSLVATIVVAVLAALGVWFFTWLVAAVVLVVCLTSFVALLVVIRRG
jgi:hypothetical protein